MLFESRVWRALGCAVLGWYTRSLDRAATGFLVRLAGMKKPPFVGAAERGRKKASPKAG